MKSQKNPNAWSCLPAAFATALEVPCDVLIALIGHDGSEITHAGLPEPLKRRGFHPQEMIKVCVEDGMAVTRIELMPSASALPEYKFGTWQPKLFDTGGWDWFKKNLFNSTGVIDCRTAVGTGHAMAYEGVQCVGSHADTYARIYDPATDSQFNFRVPEDAERRDCFFVAIWRLENITS